MIIITDDWLLILIIWQNDHKAAKIKRCKMGRKWLLKCLHEWVIWSRASGWTGCLSGRTVNTKPAEIQSSETDPRPDNSRSDNFYCNSESSDATSRPCLDCTDDSNTIQDIKSIVSKSGCVGWTGFVSFSDLSTETQWTKLITPRVLGSRLLL